MRNHLLAVSQNMFHKIPLKGLRDFRALKGKEGHMAIIGYARVSSVGQKLEIQMEKLKYYGCQRLFIEKHSG
jgi:predicted site-specific integrase-resolvase